MAAAYRAWDDGFGQLVAVKMPGAAPGDGGFLARFEREVETAQGLIHPHIVPVLDSGVADGGPYLVMPYLAGGTLAHWLRDAAGRRRPLPAVRLHDWLPAIAAALDHAHAEGVVHRDVKPANILFDAFGTAHLGDFGIAKLLEEADSDDHDAALTRTNVAVGTEYYMAPERFGRRPVLDGRCDQYSLAVCVYEMLAGRRPFEGDSGHIAVEHCNAPVPPLREGVGGPLPASLSAALDRALAKRRADRFSSCTEFARAVLADVPVAAAEAGFVTVACPACDRLLRLPLTAAGRQGACRNCRAKLSIADDGSGVWPVGEESLLPAPAAGPAGAPTEAGPHRRLPWRPFAALAAVAAALIALLVALLMPNADPDQRQVAQAPSIAPVVEPPRVDPAPPPNPAEATDDAVMPDPVPVDPVPVDPVPPPVAVAQPEVAPPPAPPAAPPVEPSLLEEIHWVRVGDPGNQAHQKIGLGAVADPFLIGRYEVTNREYCRFLNESQTGRFGLHGVAEGPTSPPAAIVRAGAPGAFRYTVTPGLEFMPVIGLRWCDAARLANWLHHGGRPDSDTEHGAYDLTRGEPTDSEAVPKQPAASVWIPSRDEWFKAAYYKGGGEAAGYWGFPTGSDSPPTACEADEAGTGLPEKRLSANYSEKSRWPKGIRIGQGGCLTAVGSNGPEGPYGTFDMGGNAVELVTVSEDVALGAVLGLCGGDAGSGSFGPLQAARQQQVASKGRGGVRLARVDQASLVSQPPLEHKRIKKLPKAAQASVDALRGVLERIEAVPLAEALPPFFQAELRRLESIKDDGLAVPLRQFRDEIKAVPALGERAASGFMKSIAEVKAMEKAGIDMAKLLGGELVPGVAQDAQNLFRQKVAEFEADLEPIREQARQLIQKLDTRIVPALRQ